MRIPVHVRVSFNLLTSLNVCFAATFHGDARVGGDKALYFSNIHFLKEILH